MSDDFNEIDPLGLMLEGLKKLSTINLDESTNLFIDELSTKRYEHLSNLLDKSRASVLFALRSIACLESSDIIQTLHTYEYDPKTYVISDKSRATKHLNNLQSLQGHVKSLYDINCNYPDIELDGDCLRVTLEHVSHEILLTSNGLSSHPVIHLRASLFDTDLRHRLFKIVSNKCYQHRTLMGDLRDQIAKSEAILKGKKNESPMDGAVSFMDEHARIINSYYEKLSSGDGVLIESALFTISKTASELTPKSMPYNVYATIYDYLMKHVKTPEDRNQKIAEIIKERVANFKQQQSHMPEIDWARLDVKFDSDVKKITTALKIAPSSVKNVDGTLNFEKLKYDSQLTKEAKAVAKENPFALACALAMRQDEADRLSGKWSDANVVVGNFENHVSKALDVSKSPAHNDLCNKTVIKVDFRNK